MFRSVIGVILRGLLGRGGYARSERANVSPLFALLLVPIIGMLGLTVETGSWIMTKRAMQNAADSAALAAASNGTTTTSGSCTTGVTTFTFECEAKLVTAKYGFVDGANNVTVTALANQACPSGDPVTTGCYKVTITKNIPISLTRIVGFNGNVAMGGGRGQQVIATATANPSSVATTFCFISLGPPGNDDFQINGGGSSPGLHGCNIAANGDARCNGGDIGATYLVLYGTVPNNKNCAINTPITITSPIVDPYAALASNIPSYTGPCSGGFPNESIGGAVSWLGASHSTCGTLTLTSNVTLTTGATGTVLYIYRGGLNLNGFRLQTAAGSSLTIVFSGPDNGTSHTPSTNGILDITAPNSGTWSGVAMYQDPALTSNINFTSSGTDPTWNITGLVYMPKATVQLAGNVNKATNGLNCFSLVSYTFLSAGNFNFYPSADSQSQCAAAGLYQPTSTIPGRTKLVA